MSQGTAPRIWTSKSRILRGLIFALAAALWPSMVLADDAMNLGRNSKIMILAGHSISLSGDDVRISRQDVTAINKHVDDILQQLERELTAFGATAVYLSEGRLSQQLARQGLKQGDEASIKEFLKRSQYTHLIAAEVQPPVNGDFEVTILVAKLPPGAQLTDIPPQQLTASASKSDLEEVINAIVFDLAKLRDPDSPKIVDISCIGPMHSVVADYTPELQMERVLSKSISSKLIAFYLRPEMQARYRSTVRTDTYKIEIENKDIKCQTDTTVKVVKPRVVDYRIRGKVGVVQKRVGNIHEVKFVVDFVRALPGPECERNIPIEKEFDRSNLHRQADFSAMFSDEIWPEYELKWTDIVKTCP